MGIGDPDIDQLTDDQDEIRNRYAANQPPAPTIARPQASSLPPVTVRPIGGQPQTQAPEPGSTGDLEARADKIPSQPGSSLRGAIKPDASTAAPSSQIGADKSELNRLTSTGSGVSQIRNPFLRGGLRTLEGIGRVVAPWAVAQVPGTELHHQVLVGQQRRAIGEDTEQEDKEAQTAKAGADTEEAQARAHALENPEPKAKEEKWDSFGGFTDNDGTPLIREENSGQVVRASDKKQPTGFKAIAPKAERPDTPEQQFIDEFSKTHPNGTVADAVAAYSTATQKPERPEKPQRQLAVVNGKVVELTPGMDVPEGTKSLTGDLAENKTTPDEQRRSDLAGNLNENLQTLEDIVTRRPDLFGPVAGRLTGLRGTIGSDDPDIGTLETIKHQIGMAQISAHGMRSAQGIDGAAESILNSFHNGPDAVKASIAAARKSVGTFQKDAGQQPGSTSKNQPNKPAAHGASKNGTPNDPLGIR